MNQVEIQYKRVAIEQEIADLEKKIATKKALLPGLIYLEKQFNNNAINDQDENEVRLRLGEYPRKILDFLYASSDLIGPLSLDDISKQIDLDLPQVKSGVRNLLHRKLVAKNDQGIEISENGKEFYKKYKEKQ